MCSVSEDVKYEFKDDTIEIIFSHKLSQFYFNNYYEKKKTCVLNSLNKILLTQGNAFHRVRGQKFIKKIS